MASVNSAGAINSLVGYSFFSSKTSCNDVVQSDVTETTTATLVFSDAVNELLFRKRRQFIG